MRLIKGSLGGLVLAGVLAIMPAAVFAHGGAGGGGGGHGGGGGGHGFGGGGFGGGHGFGGGGGGHGFVGGGGHGLMGGGGHGFTGGGGHAFMGGGGRGSVGFAGRFNGRGFSPGSSGTRGFSTARFSGRGDHDRFGDRGFHGRDHDFRDRRFRDFNGAFFDFGGDFGYPDYSYDYPYYYPYYYPYSYDNGNGYLSVERAVQEELAQLGYYHGPADGTIGPETQRAIRWFQSVAKIPVTGRIDNTLLRALQIS